MVKTIKISDETHERLTEIKEFLEKRAKGETGLKTTYTYEDVITYLAIREEV